MINEEFITLDKDFKREFDIDDTLEFSKKL